MTPRRSTDSRKNSLWKDGGEAHQEYIRKSLEDGVIMGERALPSNENLILSKRRAKPRGELKRLVFMREGVAGVAAGI